MSFARDVYTATGGQTDFTITFAYLDEDDVLVYQNGTLLTKTTEYTFFTATTIRLVTGATLNDTIIITRATSQDARTTSFTAGTLTSTDMNADSNQLFYMAQEAIDIANTALGLDTDDNWTAQSKRIKDVTDPTLDQDAATKNYVDQAVTGSLGSPISIANGGTGSTTAAAALTALGAAGLATDNVFTKSQTLKKGSDVASAAALAVNVDGNFFDVTGTTTITSLASKGIGTEITLQFDAALTLTHHATNLILPGGANIVTAAGDTAKFFEYGSGTWLCTNYERASGDPGKVGGLFGSIQVFTNTAGGTWTKPAGLKRVIVHVYGAGGGGGGSSTTNASGGGGSGGGYSMKVIEASALGSTETVTVGTGGTGGITTGHGSAGSGNSAFGSHCSATPGGAGKHSSGTTAANCVADAPGAGSGGDINLSGGYGGSGGSYTHSSHTSGGCPGPHGGRPTPGAGIDTAGRTGNNYGAGGSGGTRITTSVAGGDGSDGAVIVEEYY